MSRRPTIAEAMGTAAGSVRSARVDSVPERPVPATESRAHGQRSRIGTKPITGHYPPQVRSQLKILAAEQERTMEDMLAEGLNLLFSAYGKPELAPTGRKGD